MGARKKVVKQKKLAKPRKSSSTGNNSASKLRVEALVHDDAKRRNIPTAEYQSIMQKNDKAPVELKYKRNLDLDPQLVWRGKDQEDMTDLTAAAPPLYIQEKVHPKVLIDELLRASGDPSLSDEQLDLFADFNGLPSEGAKTEFYRHDSHWSNRMILGDSFQVMSSLAEREGLRGKVQCVYVDPPYGIKFNSNFQWSTTSRDVKDGNVAHITREPEQVKAFRDTWRNGIHSYLTYLRDRLTIARDLLHDTGSVFLQIGDENLHRVRAVMDEVFGENNFVSLIQFKKTGGFDSGSIPSICDYVVWYAKSKPNLKYHPLFEKKIFGEGSGERYRSCWLPSGEVVPVSKFEDENGNLKLPEGARLFLGAPLTSDGAPGVPFPLEFEGVKIHHKANQHWKTTKEGLGRLGKAGRLFRTKNFANYRLFIDDFAATPLTNMWDDTMGTAERDKVYVVQTVSRIVQRCILMTTDPGDLVLDPTCGSGTTAYVAENWGRRWITIDTSRVALALARARVMGARYPYYILADSKKGQLKEAELRRSIPSSAPVHHNLRQGFVYERVPHITLKSVASNLEIDVIWDKHSPAIEKSREALNKVLKEKWAEWEVPLKPDDEWSDKAKGLHAEFRVAVMNRQREMDLSIAAKADPEFLHDKPYEDKSRIRVAGPFTVESVSPHRVLALDNDSNIISKNDVADSDSGAQQDFTAVIIENLRNAGVQQAHKEDRIKFTSLQPWPGQLICAEGVFVEEPSGKKRRAAIFVGPEFGTVSRPDLVEAAKEAGDSDFDLLIACAFNFDARSSDFGTLGRIPILKARMNADLHMANDLKNTGKGNLFVIFGEPDIEISKAKGDLLKVKIHGVDVFHPNTGEVRSDSSEGIACWFIDTDYNEESFFVRHAYFLGANDPYKALKNALKSEINEDAWETLKSDTSRPFAKPTSGRIAVKVINHLGDEVMKVFKV